MNDPEIREILLSLKERQTRSEVFQEKQSQDITTLVNTFNGFIQKTDQKFDVITTEMSKVGKVSWQLVATIISIVLGSTISGVGLVLTIMVLAAAPMWTKIEDHSSELAKHMEEPGHREAMEKHARNEIQFENIENSITALDQRYKETIDLRMSPVYTQLNDMDEDIKLVASTLTQVMTTRNTREEGSARDQAILNLQTEIARLQGILSTEARNYYERSSEK